MGKRAKPRKEKKAPEATEQSDGTQKLLARLWAGLPPEAPEIVREREKQRKGKKTLVMVGTSPDSCGYTPWFEEGIDDFWGLNDAHVLPMMQMDRITGWFQLHHRWRWSRKTARRGAAHFDWLKEKRGYPIWMQRKYPDVPDSVSYPLKEVAREFLFSKKWNEPLLGRGPGWQKKYFPCSFAYMLPLAYMEGYERVEMYGVELAQQVEYTMQRPGTEFWIGALIARGIQVYMPARQRIVGGTFYGYRYPGIRDAVLEYNEAIKKGKDPGWKPDPETMKDEDNVGDWSDFGPAAPPVEEADEATVMARAMGYAGILESTNGNAPGGR